MPSVRRSSHQSDRPTKFLFILRSVDVRLIARSEFGHLLTVPENIRVDNPHYEKRGSNCVCGSSLLRNNKCRHPSEWMTRDILLLERLKVIGSKSRVGIQLTFPHLRNRVTNFVHLHLINWWCNFWEKNDKISTKWQLKIVKVGNTVKTFSSWIEIESERNSFWLRFYSHFSDNFWFPDLEKNISPFGKNRPICLPKTKA